MYAGVKYLADFLNYLREIPFSYIAANAEKHIAKLIFVHLQNQSLEFHLSRETGKILSIISKGASSFATILRYLFFNLVPMFVEIGVLIAVVGMLYPQKFAWICIGFVVLYFLVTVLVTEWRA
jgi:ATP-binding cassette subfamily B protein